MMMGTEENPMGTLVPEVDGVQPAHPAEADGAGEVANDPRTLLEVIDSGALEAPPLMKRLE